MAGSDRSTAGRARRSVAAACLGIAAALCLTPGLAGPAAAAEPTAEELAAARQLFHEGRELEKKKEWEEAIKRFRRVGAVKMTPQVRYHIALCEEHLGRLVEAINGFELAAEEARRAGKGAEEVLTSAPKRAAALRKRVAAVRLKVSGTLRTSRVYVDDRHVPPALFGTEIPLDPGAHAITVQRDGAVTFSKEINVAERGREEVEITIEDPEAPPEPQDPPPVVEKPPEPPPPPPPPPPPDPWPARIPALVAGGVGIAALAGAGVFFGLREAAFSDVRETCEDETKACDPSTEERFEQGKTYTTVAAVLGGVGVAGLAAGGVLWFVLAPEEAKPGQKVSIRVAPAPGGVRVMGAF
jgi:hypothetical protein